MSRKFAQITANLLARKGEAVPSLTNGTAVSLEPQLQPLPPREPQPPHWATELRHAFVADITSGKPIAKRSKRARNKAKLDPSHRKIFLKVSARENERLEIAAVKKGATRNELIRLAIETYLDELTREFQDKCHCISGDTGPGEPCCSAISTERLSRVG